MTQIIRMVWVYLRLSIRFRRMEALPIPQERLIYSCPLSGSKRRNLVLREMNRPQLRCSGFIRPHILHIGVTTHCNLHCLACPTGTGSLGRPKEHLVYDLFCRTIDSLRGSLLFMLFWDWGEPFLHPQLPDMIEYAGRSGIRAVVSTNGNVKCSDEKIEQLIRARPSTIVVCVDGVDQETYESYRYGGSLETVLQTVRRLVETRDQMGQTLPMIEFRSLATKGTEHQLPGLLNLAQESGADLFSVKTLRPFDYRSAEVDGELVPEKDELSRYRYKQNQRSPDSRTGIVSEGPLTCGKPLHAPTLNSDGALTFCSYAQHENEFFGNLKGRSFSKVWKNSVSRKRRKEFLEGCGTQSCRTCYFRSNPVPTILHQVVLRPLPDGITAEIPQTPEEFLKQF